MAASARSAAPINPANLAGGHDALAALRAIAAARTAFVSRGDKSGTDALEKRLWHAAGLLEIRNQDLVCARIEGAATTTWISTADEGPPAAAAVAAAIAGPAATSNPSQTGQRRWHHHCRRCRHLSRRRQASETSLDLSHWFRDGIGLVVI
jgi:hypothetical protein